MQYIGVVSIIDLLTFILSGDDAEERITSRVSQAIGSTQESMSLWIEPVDRPLYFAMEQFCKGDWFSTHNARDNQLINVRHTQSTCLRRQEYTGAH
jgi:hypothetical protein